MTDPIKRDDALEPCPFCRGEASKIPDPNHSTGWEVGCFSGECDVEPHVWAVHLETAVMQWNTRAMPAVAVETCWKCDGSGMAIGDGGDPCICNECKYDGVVPVADSQPAAIPALQARIEELMKERDEINDRMTAMKTGDWSKIKLVRFENGQLDLSAGPIPVIAEYLSQMMKDGEGKHFNFMEIQIDHKSAGPMVLSLQRKFGQTPGELHAAAQDKLAKAVEALQWYADLKNHIVPDDSGPQPIDLDRGDRARIALAELEGK